MSRITNSKTSAHDEPQEKVGSSESAAEHFGGKGDFGIPVSQAQPGQQTVIDGSLEERPLGTRLPPADAVGVPDSGLDSGSGGEGLGVRAHTRAA
jgi:hypothetical protein